MSASGVLVALALAPTGAAGQTPPEAEATRRLLINSAQAASASGDHAGALDFALRASTVRATPSLLTFIAREHLALGQLTPALAAAQRCVADATADPSTPERASTLAACTDLTRDLERRVGRVVVRAPTPSPAGLRVWVGDAELPPALWGVPYVVSPGALSVRAEAPGREPYTEAVRVEGGASLAVSLTLREPPPPGARRAVPGDGVPPASALPRTLGWVALGAGALSLGLGVASSLVIEDAYTSFNDDPSRCQQTNGSVTRGGSACQGYLARGASWEPVALASYVVGGALAVTGLVLVLVSPASAPRRGASRGAWGCGAGPAAFGLSCAVTF